VASIKSTSHAVESRGPRRWNRTGGAPLSLLRRMLCWNSIDDRHMPKAREKLRPPTLLPTQPEYDSVANNFATPSRHGQGARDLPEL